MSYYLQHHKHLGFFDNVINVNSRSIEKYQLFISRSFFVYPNTLISVFDILKNQCYTFKANSYAALLFSLNNRAKINKIVLNDFLRQHPFRNLIRKVMPCWILCDFLESGMLPRTYLCLMQQRCRKTYLCLMQQNLSVTNAIELTKNLPVSNAIEVAKNLPVSNAIEVAKNLPVTNSIELAKNLPVSNAIEVVKNLFMSNAIKVVKKLSVSNAI